MESHSGGLSYTSVVILTVESGEVYIVITLSTQPNTQVIYIDPCTGSLSHKGKWGDDVFKSEQEARDHVINRSPRRRYSAVLARAVLGYAALGSCGLLLVATKVGPSISELPGGGRVYTVVESQWIRVRLENAQPVGRGEMKNVNELMELDIDGKYYFCETRDITRPFPSRMAVEKADEEFVWNGWLASPFKSIGLPRHCVTLLQGFAECREFGSSGQQEGIVALIARRSRLHPGTRYLARGLNSCSGTGNEVECEQLVWVPKKAGQSVPFSRYIWRRGTIPIWWGAELKKITAAEAEIYVADHQPYKGTTQYYQRLSKRYDARASNPHNKNDLVPIVCINLLRNGEGKSESLLVHHFEESLNHLITTENLPHTKIELMNYDWHANNKAIGEIHTIEGLWKLIKESTIAVGISEGDYLVSRQRTRNCSGEIIQSDEYEGAFCLRTSQNGALRYNCADSLDRTNAASFFGAVQVFVEQCRRLMIPLCSGYELLEHATCPAPLPPGWERRSDAGTGKSFYIDHNTRITTWHHPCPDRPWKRFDLTFEEFKRSTMLLPVAQLSELFLLAGDIHATLYTGSKAMHSQILSIFNDERGKFKQFSAAQSMKITLQRRYKNVVVDSSRQKQLEIFLGMRLFKHLPSVPFRPLHVLSRQPACILKPVPGIQGSGDDISLLSFKGKSLIWVCPEAADVIELFIYLSEPCHVCELLLTVSHGADDSTSPATVVVRTGRDLDGLKLVLECGSIPHCANGTKISIPLSGRRRHGPEPLSLLYDFDELEGEFDFLTRVVALTFYPAVSGRAPVTLGEVEVLGASIPWRSVFMQEETVNSSLLEKSIPFMHDLDGLNSSQCGITEYTKFIKSFMGSETRKKIDFIEAMKLEIERLHLNLSAAERDKALLSIEIDPSSINPNLLIDETYMIKLCRVASSLAFLGQTSMEDKIIGSIGLETSNENNIIDFWNVVGLRESCRGGKCRVQAETQGSPQSVGSTLFMFCHHCGRQVCEACCAGKGALLITTSHNLRRFNIGLSHGNQHLTAEEIICKQCCSDVVLHALVLDYVRVLLSSRRTSRMIMAMDQALDLVVGLRHVDRVVQGSEKHDPRMLLNGEESLAEFPFASFLHSVDTAVDAANPYSLLLPLDSGPHDAYWKATTNTSSIDFTIVLGSLSDVSGVILVVSPCGYSKFDAPSVKIWTSIKIRDEERSFMGRWDVHSLLESSMELYGPENHGVRHVAPRHIRFSFTNLVRCRIIWITLSLEKDASLNEGDTHLHAKRLIVVGSSVRDNNEIDLTPKESLNSNHLKLIKSLELPPRLSRFKVPIEGERSIDNDLVLEMHLSPTTLLAGFRLDAFSAIQPRVSHSPGSNALRDHLFSLLDQRNLNPAVLYLRVSILQEPQHKMVSVAEYRLPGTKPGTTMYFDFPKELQTQRILFRLVGDVASFSDDPAEQDDAEFGISPVAVGLSLSSRIKLYYYADSYEVGKWAAAV